MTRRLIFISLLFSLLAGAASYFSRTILHTEQLLSDVGGLSAFLGVFGALYGILTAFVVVEVWVQFNRTSELIDKEAQGLERLYRLALYFRDNSLKGKMKAAIDAYAKLVIKGKFQMLGEGARNIENGQAFRKIAEIIRNVQFNDDHDSVVFGQILEHYGNLAQIRTERQTQSLVRLPGILKLFIYLSSLFALLTFIVMPFSTQFYGLFSVMVLAFVQGMIFQMIEDLDNPFVGHWKLTPEPFERAIRHIEQDY